MVLLGHLFCQVLTIMVKYLTVEIQRVQILDTSSAKQQHQKIDSKT